MKILSFSYCFPNHMNPTWGMFVFQRLSAISELEELQVCSPVPWFPGMSISRGNPGPHQEEWNGLTVHRLRFFYFPGIFKNRDARFYASGIRRWLHTLIKAWRPDVLDAHFMWPDGVGVALLAKEFEIPYIITLRGKIYECLPIPSQRAQCIKALKEASTVISVSGQMAEEARKLGVSEDHLKVIPNGVDRSLFKPGDKHTCRRELGLPETGRLLITVAHLGHRKGHHEVIRALSDIPEDIHLIIVGGSAQGGTPETLRGVAAKAGVMDRLILPGPQPYEKIPMYFNAADASVLASYREGCPNAVLESLACGTPVVASDVGAVRDILPDPDAGRIVPAKQVGLLQIALTDVLSRKWDPTEVVRASGVKSWDEVAREVQTVFQEAVL